MSLINQMLQDLDARGTPAAGGGILQGQLRAVPERQGVHPAWWLVLVLGIALCGAGAWMWLGQISPTSVPKTAIAELPLKFETDLNRQAAAQAPLVESAAPTPPSASPSEQHMPPAGVSKDEKPSLLATDVETAELQPVAAPALSAKPSADVVSQPPTLAQTAVGASGATVSASSTKPATTETTNSSQSGIVANAAISKQYRESTPQLNAENEYRKATVLIQQGKNAEANIALERALQLDAQHVAARQTLVALLIDEKRQDEAVRRLREGLHADASQTGLATILARLLVERGELKPAIETLNRSLPHAVGQADYHAFLAALLQRDTRHREAVEHYDQALRKAPHNGIWWMGLGISLQAENRTAEAVDAFTRAKSTAGLSPELKAFVDQRLNNLQ